MSRRNAQEALAQQLEESRVRLLSGNGPPELLTTLRSVFPDLSDNVYIIDHLPEHAEDIYDVLVDATTVVHVEVPRPGVSQRVVMEEMSLERYREIRSSMSKLHRRRLDAILLLAWQRREAAPRVSTYPVSSIAERAAPRRRQNRRRPSVRPPS